MMFENRKLIALTVQKILQFEFYVININLQGSKSHRAFHMYSYNLCHAIPHDLQFKAHACMQNSKKHWDHACWDIPQAGK